MAEPKKNTIKNTKKEDLIDGNVLKDSKSKKAPKIQNGDEDEE